jgi:hypothetical protein
LAPGIQDKEHPMLRTALLALLLLLPRLQADDVTDWIDEARKAWLEGKGDLAAQNLDYAAQLIRQAKGEKLEAALPEPIAGWKKTDSGSSAAGAAMLGGATAASASFEKSEGEVYSSCDISITTDSPMLSALMMSFANPMLMGASGQKLIKVGSNKASMDYDAENRSGTINVVVAQKVLVSVNGSGLAEEELRAFAAAVKYDVIDKVLQGQQ